MKTTQKASMFACALIILLAALGSCNKSDSGTTPPPPPPPPPSEKEIKLTKGPWLVDNEGIDTDTDGVIDIQDVRMGSPCNTDDVWDFIKGGSLEFDEGSLKCDANDPETVLMAWHFVDDETSIYIDYFDSNFKIYKLTDTQFQIYTVDSTSGTPVWKFQQYKR